MRPFDPRLLKHARSVRTLIAGSVAIGGAAAACTIAQAVVIARILTDAALRGASLGDLTRPLALLAALMATRAALAWAGEELARRSAGGMTRELRKALLEHVLRLGPRWSGAQRTAQLQLLATTGIDGLETYASRYLPQLVLAALVPAMMTAWLLFADPLSAMIVVLTLPLIPVFMALVGWHTERRTRSRLRAMDILAGHFLDVIAGLPTLKVFGRAKVQAQAVRRATDDYRRTTMATLKVAFLSSLVLELLSTLSVALVAVAVGLRLVDGSMGLEAGLAVLILVPEAYLPLRSVGTQFHASMDGLTAAGRLFEVLETEAPAGGSRGDVPSPAEVGIEARGVRVRYPDRGRDALNCAAARVRPGRITVLTGPSGAGKTTLLHVLAGLIQPDEGVVTIGGIDLTDIAQPAWRDATAYVGQRPFVMAGTVTSNLALGNPGASASAVAQALDLADAADFVSRLDGGRSAQLGDGGARLSAGQRQRLALARAYLRDADLLLLDEPTSALDPLAEQRVLDGLRRHAAGRTVVIASHSAEVLRIADEIIDLGEPVGIADEAIPAGTMAMVTR